MLLNKNSVWSVAFQCICEHTLAVFALDYCFKHKFRADSLEMLKWCLPSEHRIGLLLSNIIKIISSPREKARQVYYSL